MIEFNVPYLTGREFKYIKKAVACASFDGGGIFSKKCCELMQQKFGIKRVFLTTSGTHALEMACILADIGPADEVILPSFSYPSTANCVLLHGAKPVFADIREDTLNLNEREINKLLTERTKAVIPVHYAGVSCDMDNIMKLAFRHSLMVICDSALAFNAKYEGKYIGSISPLEVFSFHRTKDVFCGEGGALLINDEKYVERADIIYEKGTDRRQFLEGKKDRYTWVDIGSGFAMPDMPAAFLLAQLENMDIIKERRRRIFEAYFKALKPLDEKGFIRLPIIPDCCETNYHMFYILANNNEKRDGLLKFLKENGINAVFHYIPLHSSPMGKKLGAKRDLPVTEDISKRILRLPMHTGMKQKEIDYTVKHIYKFFDK